jgi:hypothetical protein
LTRFSGFAGLTGFFHRWKTTPNLVNPANPVILSKILLILQIL